MFDVTLLILLGLAALGFISHNTTVAVSILVLIIVRVTPLSTFFPWIEKQGLSIGIIILTIGVMAPIASGTLPRRTGWPAYCRGSGFADCGETVVNPAIYRPGVCPRPFLNIVIKAVVESYPSV